MLVGLSFPQDNPSLLNYITPPFMLKYIITSPNPYLIAQLHNPSLPPSLPPSMLK